MSALIPIGAVPAEQLPGLFPADLVPQARSPGPDAAGTFGAMVSKGLSQVNEGLLTSQADLQALAAGDVQNLHQTMIRLEEARLSFQLMMQVRGRLLEAYQDVMKMQI
jgi:flagellar hook-basal body complex protein FliE